MNLKLGIGGLIMGLSLLQTGTAEAGPARANFERRFERFVDQIRRDPSAPPGFAIVVVERGNTILQRAYGTRDARTGDPLTLDAPIYTASTTKSFVGLLAAQLDAKGVLPLGATLRDVWPNIGLPAPLAPSRPTARAFLAHISGIESPVLSWRFSDTGEYRSEDVPAILGRFAVPANRAFDYGNVGPVIYTAMAEARLKRSWRDALQDYVARPLGLTRFSARLEDFAPSEVALCHARWGGRWTVAPPKPTALLDAGGGVLSSARDAGTYLRAFTSDGASTHGRIPAAVLRETYRKVATQDREFFGFRRDGYGLGWDLSTYGPHRVVSRTGGYPGCRSIMAFLPDRKFGVVVFTLGDVGGNLLGTSLVQQAIDLWTGDPAADRRAAERANAFRDQVAKAIRDADAVPTMPTDRSAGASADYVGVYVDEGRGPVAVSLHPDGMRLTAGELRLLLAPTSTDGFSAYDAAVPGPPLPIRFTRGRDGRVDGFVFREVTFAKRGRANP